MFFADSDREAWMPHFYISHERVTNQHVTSTLADFLNENMNPAGQKSLVEAGWRIAAKRR